MMDLSVAVSLLPADWKWELLLWFQKYAEDMRENKQEDAFNLQLSILRLGGLYLREELICWLLRFLTFASVNPSSS